MKPPETNGPPSPCGSRRPARSGRTRPPRPARAGAAPAVAHRPLGQLDRRGPQPPGGRPHQHLARRRAAPPRPAAPAAPAAAIRASTSTGPIGTERRISKVTRPTWKSSASGSSSISRPSSADGRPGVLGAGVPGAAGQLGGAEAVAVGLVEGVGHAAILGGYGGGARPRRLSSCGCRTPGSRRGRRLAPSSAADRAGRCRFRCRGRGCWRGARGVQPGGEDRPHGADRAGAPGDVLGRLPAASLQVAECWHPEGELAAAGFVAEFVAAEDVAGPCRRPPAPAACRAADAARPRRGGGRSWSCRASPAPGRRGQRTSWFWCGQAEAGASRRSSPREPPEGRRRAPAASAGAGDRAPAGRRRKRQCATARRVTAL